MAGRYSKLDIVSSFVFRILRSPQTLNISTLAVTLTFSCIQDYDSLHKGYSLYKEGL